MMAKIICNVYLVDDKFNHNHLTVHFDIAIQKEQILWVTLFKKKFFISVQSK